MPQAITVKELEKRFGEHEILSKLSFSISRGEIVALIGPNGCGKTTLLNILSGIEAQTGGEISTPSLHRQAFSYIFQNYRESLLPWKNNYDNIALPLTLKGPPSNRVNQKVGELGKMFGFEEHLTRFPYALSGGQQQILAFLRALVTEPHILFIDEPFSALDYENNLRLRAHLLAYHAKYVPTILIITHNIEEAVHLASKIMVLSKKPTQLIDIIENPTPYPRNVDYLKSRSFFEVKEKVLDAFAKGARL